MNRRALVPFLAILTSLVGTSVLLPGPSGAAQLATFESVEGSFVEGPFIFKNQDLAQSFTATMSYRLVAIEVMVHDLDLTQPVDPLNLTIEADAGGVPSGIALSGGLADGAFGYLWLTFNLMSPLDLAAGTTYWIVLRDENGMNQQSGYKWAMKTGDTYTGGVYAYRNGGGPWSRVASDDLLFRTWGLTGPLVTADLTVDSPTAAVWDPLVYTVSFNNSGTETASSVWTNVSLSANMTYESDTAASAGGTYLGPMSWLFNDVDIGPHSFRLNVRVNPGIFDGLRMDTTLRLEYANATEGMQESTESTVTVTARVPSITVLKTASPRFLGPGENLTYTVTIVNSGSRPSLWLWVNDTLPPEVVYLSNTASLLANYTGEWWDGATLRVNLTVLPQGSFAFDIAVRTRPGLLNGTAFTNTVTVDFTDNRGFTVVPNATASATARIQGASITVAKSATVDAAGPGQEVHYRIRYDNRGNAVARWAWINDTLPPEVEYVSDTGGGVLSGSVVRFAYANVTVGNHFLTITVRVRNGTPDGTIVRNVVDLAHTDSDGSRAPASSAAVDVLVVTPIITLWLGAPATGDPGDVLDLGVTIDNEGNATATGVWVNLTLPSGMGNVSDDAASLGGIPTAAGWYFPDLAPGNLTFTVRTALDAGLANGTALRVDATADYVDGMGRTAASEPAAHVVVITAPMFDLAAAVARPTVPVGESVTLTVAYANRGAGVASDVWVNVTIAERASIVSASEPWTATTGVRYTWHFEDVAPGSRELRITLRAEPNGAPGAAPLSATLDYTDANGNLAGNRTAATSFATLNAGWAVQQWGLLVLLATVATLTAFIGYKVYGVGSREKGEILQLFLLHKSGLLIKHYTRHLHGALDTDILAGMIVAVQNFVRESFQFKAGDLEEMTFGKQRILLAHGEYAILAAVVSGRYLDRLKSVLRQGVLRLETEYGVVFADWGGVVDEFDGIDTLLDDVLRARHRGRNGNGNGPTATR